MKYAVIYEKTATGYSAAPDIPGCIAAGVTLTETAELMRGAIELHLETMREDGDTLPRRPPSPTISRFQPKGKRRTY